MGFNPLAISNCVGWFDAGQLNLTEGEPVSVWRNLTHNSDARQFHLDKRPLFSEGSIVFDNTDRVWAGKGEPMSLEIGPLPTLEGTSVSILLVARVNCTLQPVQHLLSAKFGEGSFKSHAMYELLWFGEDRAEREIAGKIMWAVRTKDGNVIWRCQKPTYNWELIDCVWDGNTVKLCGEGATGDNGIAIESRCIYIGDNYAHNPSYSFNGSLKELLIFDKALGSTELEDIKKYLTIKHDLSPTVPLHGVF